jgi:hypothetical protein
LLSYLDERATWFRIMANSWSRVPPFVKILLVSQAGLIIGLSAWIYNEYMNNRYLQTYVSSLVSGGGSMIAFLGLGGVLGTALLGILLKAGNILGEIEHLSEKVENSTDDTEASPERSASMPVLQIKGGEPVDEVGRLHSSLRRWNEQSKNHQ